MIKDKMDKGLVSPSETNLVKHTDPSCVQYKQEQEIVDDLRLMLNNAKLYNEDESDIFKHACRLDRALSHKYKILMNRKDKLILSIAANRLSNPPVTKKY